MLNRAFVFCILSGGLISGLRAQDSDFGISIPVTVSGGAMYTGRLQLEDPNTPPVTAGLRLMFYPTLKLGPHWFAYAALQARLTPYFYYDAYEPNHEWYLQAVQAFIGYALNGENKSLVIKAGRLSSAFGAFPLHYDDAENPLLDQPLSYIQTLTLRHDQIPCGVRDLSWQAYGWVSLGCGGVPGYASGLTPVTLYGLPGIQAEVSGYRLDGRLQVTSGSPANPLSLGHAGQYAQWTAGGGYTIRQGFRLGISGFRGPYLDPSVATLLPAGTAVRDFPASGIGADVQWARGRWSATGEWQRFRYDSPHFTVSPSVISTYGEVKSVLTPRLFVAGRVGWLKPGGATDTSGAFTSAFAPSVKSYEVGGGYWLNRHQLLKASYEWLRTEYGVGSSNNVTGFQLVTTFHAINWAFH